MALNLPEFKRLSFDEANPFLTGFSKGQGIAQNYADYQKQMLANRIAQVNAEYARPMAEQTLINKTQANIFNPDIWKSQINKREADTNKTIEETKYIPLNELIKAKDSARLASRFGAAYQLHASLQSMDPSSRNLWISQHGDEYNSMLSTLADAMNQKPDNYIQQAIENYFPKYSQNTLNTPTVGNVKPISGGNYNVPDVSGVHDSDKKLVNDNVESFKNSLQHQSNRKAVGSQMNRRADAAVAFEQWLHDNRNKYQNMLRTINKYSGTIGSVKGWFDSKSFNTPEDYKNMLWYETSFIPTISNNIRMMEGLSSSNKQRDELHNLSLALTRKDLDPVTATKLFNDQISTLQDISDSVFKASEPNVKGTYRRAFNLPKFEGDYIEEKQKSQNKNIPVNKTTSNENKNMNPQVKITQSDITEDNIIDTMKATGLSRSGVLKELKKRRYDISRLKQ